MKARDADVPAFTAVVSMRPAGVQFRTFTELADVMSEPSWLWQGYLAPGNLTLLTSVWKSGKGKIDVRSFYDKIGKEKRTQLVSETGR